MNIIRNNIIPFPGYRAMNLFGLLFVRKDAVIGPVIVNHENIHTAQMCEMLYIPFYIWYVLEWLVRLVICRNTHGAYHNISFEKEAYLHEDDMEYLKKRNLFAWVRYVF